MEIYDSNIRSGLPLPPVVRKGRKPGSGRNLILLRKMVAGDSIWNLPYKKMMSIKHTAWKHEIPIKIRRLPDNHRYAFWKL